MLPSSDVKMCWWIAWRDYQSLYRRMASLPWPSVTTLAATTNQQRRYHLDSNKHLGDGSFGYQMLGPKGVELLQEEGEHPAAANLHIIYIYMSGQSCRGSRLVTCAGCSAAPTGVQSRSHGQKNYANVRSVTSVYYVIFYI